MKRSLIALALAAVALLGIAGPASAAHNSNNKAELTGDGVTGTAIVNYSEGTGTFNGTTRVSGLEPDTDYTFRVNGGPGGIQEICTFTTDANGAGGCSEQGLILGGFVNAEIVNEAGTVVVSDRFDRRGTCRDPQQNGTQCEAPGQVKKA